MSSCLQNGDFLGEDVLVDILNRLPAKSLASAACVCCSWRHAANKVLSVPQIVSALSQNLCLEDAIEDIMDSILSKTIRPTFAIAFAGQRFKLLEISSLLRKKLGLRIPTITCYAPGIIGPDAVTSQQMEVMWKQPTNESSKVVCRSILARQSGLLVTVGSIQGLLVDAVPLYNSLAGDERNLFLDSLVNRSDSMAESAHPSAIILLADPRADIVPILQSIDERFHKNTVVVGGLVAEHNGSPLSHSKQATDIVDDNYLEKRTKLVGTARPKRETLSKKKNSQNIDAVALVFWNRKDETNDCKRILFNVAVSSGLAPVGPLYKVVSARISKDSVTHETTTWITCKKEEPLLFGGQSLLEDLESEVGSDIFLYEGLYIGVSKRSKRMSSKGKHRAIVSFTIHEMLGADDEYLFVNGEGIKTGDVFRFYKTDSETAKFSSNSSLAQLQDKLKSCTSNVEREGVPHKNSENKVLGGILFSCVGRGESYFGEQNVDSSSFSEKFPGVPISGTYCLGEIGPPSVRSWETTSNDDSNSKLNSYSAMFLVLSYA